jgi:hypothetical protein
MSVDDRKAQERILHPIVGLLMTVPPISVADHAFPSSKADLTMTFGSFVVLPLGGDSLVSASPFTLSTSHVLSAPKFMHQNGATDEARSLTSCAHAASSRFSEIVLVTHKYA